VKQNIPADEVRFYFVKNDGYSLDRQRRELAGENDLDKYFMNDEDDLITVNSQEIQNNLFALQGKKYISKEDLARIIFGTDDLLRLSTILTPVRAERVTIEDLDEYELLGVRSYGLGAFKKPLKKGYEISNSMKYYRAKSNHLFWCGVDTKNGAFGVIKQDQNNCVYTSNMKMMKIDDSRVIPYFIEILFRNKKVQEYFDNYISGSTNRKSIKQRELLEFYIPNYSREQQQKIVDKVIKAERNIRNHVSSIEESIEMTNTITVTT
jgi:hypothetical protein